MNSWTTVVKCQRSVLCLFNQFSHMFFGQIVCQTREHTQFISQTHNFQLFLGDVSYPTLWFLFAELFFVVFVLQNVFYTTTTESATNDFELYKSTADVSEWNTDQKRGFSPRLFQRDSEQLKLGIAHNIVNLCVLHYECWISTMTPFNIFKLVFLRFYYEGVLTTCFDC